MSDLHGTAPSAPWMLRHRRSAAAAAGLSLLATTLAFAPAAMAGTRADQPDTLRQLLESRETAAPTTPEAAPAVGLIVTGGSSALAGRALPSTVGSTALSVSDAPHDLGSNVTVLDFEAPVAAAEAAKTAKAIEALPGVTKVEVNGLMQATAAAPVTPNDPEFGKQHWLWDNGSITSYDKYEGFTRAAGGYSIKAPSLWRATKGKRSIVVAIVDTGWTSHPDLNANTVAGYDLISSKAISRDGNGRDSNPKDEGDWTASGECGPAKNSSWHGTHVAGIVAARAGNGAGVAGAAPNVRIQHVRTLGKCGGSFTDIAAGILWASGAKVKGTKKNRTPAKIINLSLGGYGSCPSVVQKAVTTARKKGSVVVVAAGNDNTDASKFAPANCKGVVTVASTDPYGLKASYSNYGKVVDVAAPGGDMAYGQAYGSLSTLNTGKTTPGAPTYAFYQGTSMATPAVSGALALIASTGSHSRASLESAIRKSVMPFTRLAGYEFLECTKRCGKGIVDVTRVPGNIKAPAIKGTAKVGKKLKVSYSGTWIHSPSSFRYQWLRNGKAIKKATKKTYKLREADRGARISVRVKAIKSGYVSIVYKNSASKKVKAWGTATTLKVSKKSWKYGKKAATFTSKVKVAKGAVRGKVYFKLGKKTLAKVSIKSSKRTATVTYRPKASKLKKGKRTIRAVFVPSSQKYAKSGSKTIAIRVK